MGPEVPLENIKYPVCVCWDGADMSLGRPGISGECTLGLDEVTCGTWVLNIPLEKFSNSPPKEMDQRDSRRAPHLVAIPHGVQLLDAPPQNFKVSFQKGEAAEPATVALGTCRRAVCCICGRKCPTKLLRSIPLVVGIALGWGGLWAPGMVSWAQLHICLLNTYLCPLPKVGSGLTRVALDSPLVLHEA